MAFTCEHCHKALPVRTKPIRVVIERKTVQHPTKRDATGKVIENKPGTQIVREINVCGSCARSGVGLD